MFNTAEEREVVIHFTAFVHSLFNNRSCSRKPDRSANVSFFSLASNWSDYSSFGLKIQQLTEMDTLLFKHTFKNFAQLLEDLFSAAIRSKNRTLGLTFKPSISKTKTRIFHWKDLKPLAPIPHPTQARFKISTPWRAFLSIHFSPRTDYSQMPVCCPEG